MNINAMFFYVFLCVFSMFFSCVRFTIKNMENVSIVSMFFYVVLFGRSVYKKNIETFML